MTRKTVSWIAIGSIALLLLITELLPAQPNPPPGLLRTIQPTDRNLGFGTMALSPDGKTLATGNDESPIVTFWDVGTGKQTASLGGNASGVHRIDYSPRGDRFLVLSQCDKSCNDKILISTLSTTARLFNLHDGRLLHTFPHEDASAHTAFLTEDGIATVKFVQDGNRILASRRVVVSLRDPKDGSVTKTLELPEDIDRTWLSGSGRYALARRGNGEAGGILWGIKSDKPVKLFPIDGIFSGAAFSSDGRKLVYCCGMSITVSSIQDYPGSIHYGVPGTFIASIAVSHDGSLILSGDRGKSKTPSSVKLMRKLGLEIRVQPRKTTPPIAALSCGKTGRILRTFPGHDLMIHTVAFTPDTKRAITASKDRIQIWDISDVRTETQQ